MPKDVESAAHSKPDALQRVADALGVPAASFTSDVPAASRVAETAELLRLWTAIRDRDDRKALLATARDLVSRYDVGREAAE